MVGKSTQKLTGGVNIVKKKTENATKFAQAIERLRALGLVVNDRTKEGGSIGITGVHKPREG
jgi:hypothetical protein